LSTFTGLIDILKPDDQVYTENNEKKDQLSADKEQEIINNRSTPFDINEFIHEIDIKTQQKNKSYWDNAVSISGYDIAHNCILHTVKKLLNVPVKSYANKWMPVLMRSIMGTAIHDFIQDNTNQFTEIEPSIKVPSVHFSGRIDALISNDILVEIKSCTYDDYAKIIKTQTPRTPDFYQVIVYKYILENFLHEIQNADVKRRTPPPKLSNYNIQKFQLIYVCHQMISSDIEDIHLDMEIIKKTKKLLCSRNNQFYFMTSLVLDINDFDVDPYLDWVKRKIERINYYVSNNKLPTAEDEFVDKSKCFFCPYHKCELF
jgi:hypothetical protein